MKPLLKYSLIALGVIVLDQIVKFIVKTNMDLNESIPLLELGAVKLSIHFIENKGAAFGLTLDKIFGFLSPTGAKMILTVFSIAAVSAIVYFFYKSHKGESKAVPVLLAMVLGGALGNIIDRTFYGVFFNAINDYEGGLFFGRVVDMFYVHFWEGYVADWVPVFGGDYMSLWPIFNVADISISVGITMLLVFTFFFPDKVNWGDDSGKNNDDPEADADVDEQPGDSDADADSGKLAANAEDDSEAAEVSPAKEGADKQAEELNKELPAKPGSNPA